MMYKSKTILYKYPTSSDENSLVYCSGNNLKVLVASEVAENVAKGIGEGSFDHRLILHFGLVASTLEGCSFPDRTLPERKSLFERKSDAFGLDLKRLDVALVAKDSNRNFLEATTLGCIGANHLRILVKGSLHDSHSLAKISQGLVRLILKD